MPNFEDPAFGELFDRFADARVVLLGEATHGTSEFYCARAAITRRLVEQHGFTIVAVEADWPDAATIDRYVRHKAPITATEPAFRRFPTWMWRNVEVHDFVDWLRAHNAPLDAERRAGFFGLDIYNMSTSMRAVIDYLARSMPRRNLRDQHMFETLRQLLAWHGEGSKAIVWAHNSHIGDAAATDMGEVRGEINIGQLCREEFGQAAVLIGFGTDRGTVVAASDWDGPMEIKKVRPVIPTATNGCAATARSTASSSICGPGARPRYTKACFIRASSERSE